MIGIGRAVRVTAMAVFTAFIMLATPVLQLGGNDVSLSPVDNASAANGARVFNVGIVGYIGDMSTLNPFVFTMASEYMTIYPCYSTLLTVDIDNRLIGDLATSWSIAPDGMTWTINLARNAYFVDASLAGTNPTEAQIIAANQIPSHLVTWKDVEWTFTEVNNDTVNHLNYYFNDGSGKGIIEWIHQGVDQFQVVIKTRRPFAPFTNALQSIMILPEYIWGPLPNPMMFDNDKIIGSGFMYYGMVGKPTTVGILKRNPMWFQEANKGWQIHIDTLQYKNEMDSAQGWTDLTRNPPLIDAFVGLTPAQYLQNVLPGTTPYVTGWAQSTGFVYEYQLNQLTDALRKELGLRGSNNQLLLDPVVKEALAMSVNKPQFVQDVLSGLGTVADSVVPDIHRLHYAYPNPIQFDTAAARQKLNNAGWKYDASGNLNPGTTPLYKKGTTNNTVYHPLSFNLLSLLPETEWDVGTQLIVSWAAQAGVQYTRNLVSVNEANTLWYQGDYDTWLWDWAFTPNSDISTDCLSVHTTSQILQWSGSWWSNETYDDLYNRSLEAVDETARRQLTDAMQKLLYEDYNAQYVAYRKELYAVNYQKWDRASFGNWEEHWTLMPDMYFPWLYMQLSPVDNLAPSVTVDPAPAFEGYKGEPIDFFGSATDGSPLQYQWYWGDGTAPTGWLPDDPVNHTFANDGYYTVYFAAKENTGAGTDQFAVSEPTVVKVIDRGNAAPTDVSITPSPPPSSTLPDQGTMITFTAGATDTDPLYYSWNFGDTYTAQGPVVQHQYRSTGSYTVSLSVTDNHVGEVDRPVNATMGIAVKPNHPPTIDVPALTTVPNKNTNWTFTAKSHDQDTADVLKYTWSWGDKSTSVTATNTTWHTYKFNKVYVLKVSIDDQSGLAGHNVTDTGTVVVGGAINTAPVIDTYTATPTSVWTNQMVTFSARAHDIDVQDLTFTFTFGNGDTYSQLVAVPDANPVWCNTTYSYPNPGVMTTSVSVTDGLASVSSSPIVVTATVNQPPFVTDLVDINTTVGVQLTFLADAFDPDSAVLTYTWNFGDGPDMFPGNPVKHIYTSEGLLAYSVSVSDGDGNLVIKSATVTVGPFALTLVKGWNLICVPVVGTTYTANTLPDLVTGDEVVRFDPATGKYDRTFIKGITPGALDFPLLPSTGYWVYVGSTKTISLSGSVPSANQTRAITLPSTGGWAQVGLMSMKNTLKASNLAAMYAGGTVTVVAKFDPVTKQFTSWLAAVPMANNFVLVPGQGYWIYALGSGTLTYTP